jgi:hypothetical protein
MKAASTSRTCFNSALADGRTSTRTKIYLLQPNRAHIKDKVVLGLRCCCMRFVFAVNSMSRIRRCFQAIRTEYCGDVSTVGNSGTAMVGLNRSDTLLRLLGRGCRLGSAELSPFRINQRSPGGECQTGYTNTWKQTSVAHGWRASAHINTAHSITRVANLINTNGTDQLTSTTV